MRLARLLNQMKSERPVCCGLVNARDGASGRLALEVGETRFAHVGAVVFQLAFMRAAIGGRLQG